MTTWTFASTGSLLGGVRVTPDVLTSYEGETETTAVVLEPVQGDPIVVRPHDRRTRPRTGTFAAMFKQWSDARTLLALLDGQHSEEVWLHSPGRSIKFLPQRTRHRVHPDDGDVHEVTVEWLQLGGTY